MHARFVQTAVVECRQVSRQFAGKPALIDIDLEAKPGELLGLIGPDGAGKSTLLMILAGLLEPHSGVVSVFGEAPDRVKGKIGLVTQDFSLYPELTAYENMRYIARLHGLEEDVFRRRVYDLLARFGLYDARNRRAGNLSGGMKEKLAICCALISSPRLLLLDEPTTGVDPVSRRELWRLLTAVVDEGITVIVAVEHFDEGESCHRVAMLNEGSLIKMGAPGELREETGLERLDDIFALASGHYLGAHPEPPVGRYLPGDVVIRAERLTKHFGAVTAVKELDIAVRSGEIYGLLGANGAGKTTTIQMLCGLIRPSSGNAYINGVSSSLRRKAWRADVGYMNQKFALYDELTVEENLEFYCSAYGLEGERASSALERALAWGSLQFLRDRKVAALPRGWKQRVAFVAAAIHKPTVIFLDEPTAGADPWGRESLWSVMRSLAAEGAAILVTTHLLDEAEYCHRLGVLVEGKLISDGTPAQLKQRADFRVVEIFTDHLAAAAKALAVHYGAWTLSLLADRIRLLVPIRESEDAVRAVLLGWGFNNALVMPAPLILEEAFIAAVAGEANESL